MAPMAFTAGSASPKVNASIWKVSHSFESVQGLLELKTTQQKVTHRGLRCGPELFKVLTPHPFSTDVDILRSAHTCFADLCTAKISGSTSISPIENGAGDFWFQKSVDTSQEKLGSRVMHVEKNHVHSVHEQTQTRARGQPRSLTTHSRPPACIHISLTTYRGTSLVKNAHPPRIP